MLENGTDNQGDANRERDNARTTGSCVGVVVGWPVSSTALVFFASCSSSNKFSGDQRQAKAGGDNWQMRMPTHPQKPPTGQNVTESKKKSSRYGAVTPTSGASRHWVYADERVLSTHDHLAKEDSLGVGRGPEFQRPIGEATLSTGQKVTDAEEIEELRKDDIRQCPVTCCWWSGRGSGCWRTRNEEEPMNNCSKKRLIHNLQPFCVQVGHWKSARTSRLERSQGFARESRWSLSMRRIGTLQRS